MRIRETWSCVVESEVTRKQLEVYAYVVFQKTSKEIRQMTDQQLLDLFLVDQPEYQTKLDEVLTYKIEKIS